MEHMVDEASSYYYDKMMLLQQREELWSQRYDTIHFHDCLGALPNSFLLPELGYRQI